MKYTIISTLFASLLLLVTAQVGFAQTGSAGIQMSYVTLMNDFSVIGVGGSGFDKADRLEFVGTACVPLVLGKGIYTETQIEMSGLGAQLMSCLTPYRGSKIGVTLKGPSGVSNIIELTIPNAPGQVPMVQPSVIPEPPVSDEMPAPVPMLIAEDVPAQPYVEEVADDTSMPGTSRCTVNGEEVPCEKVLETAKTGFKIFGSIVLFLIVLGLACFVFWLWMLIHAITNPIQNKVVWIICFIIFGIITAIVYYFAVKRSFVSPVPQTQTAYTPPSQTPGVPPQTQ